MLLCKPSIYFLLLISLPLCEQAPICLSTLLCWRTCGLFVQFLAVMSKAAVPSFVLSLYEAVGLLGLDLERVQCCLKLLISFLKWQYLVLLRPKYNDVFCLNLNRFIAKWGWKMFLLQKSILQNYFSLSFCFFGHATELAGSSFPNQGSNPRFTDWNEFRVCKA